MGGGAIRMYLYGQTLYWLREHDEVTLGNKWKEVIE